jgi:hypothetical protein
MACFSGLWRLVVAWLRLTPPCSRGRAMVEAETCDVKYFCDVRETTCVLGSDPTYDVVVDECHALLQAKGTVVPWYGKYVGFYNSTQNTMYHGRTT